MVQLTTELLDLLDRRAAKDGKSRSELIRLAVEQYFRTDIEAQIDEAILDGYRRVPPTDEFDALPTPGPAASSAQSPGERVNRGEVWWVEAMRVAYGC